MRTLLLIGNISLWAASIPAILFVVFYARSRWETNQVGRSTMALSVCMALILFVNSLAVIWPHYPGRIYIRLFAFALIVPVLWWRFISLLVVQRQAERYTVSESVTSRDEGRVNSD